MENEGGVRRSTYGAAPDLGGGLLVVEEVRVGMVDGAGRGRDEPATPALGPGRRLATAGVVRVELRRVRERLPGERLAEDAGSRERHLAEVLTVPRP